MAYEHGIKTSERPTSILAPNTADSGIQVVIGTAPINLTENPSAAVNKPILTYSFEEAARNVGYSDDFEKFTLCQSMDISYRIHNAAPIIFINVLDPTKHVTGVTGAELKFTAGKAVIEEEGILTDSSFKITGGEANTDYITSYDDLGYTVITLISEKIAQNSTTTAEYKKLDPSKVTATDILGGIDAVTLKPTGISLIDKIYFMFGVLPGILLAPGYSHIPSVGLALTAKAEKFSSVFKCIAYTDTDNSKQYTEVGKWKNDNGYNSQFSVPCYLKPVIDNKKYFGSAVLGAVTAAVDAENGGIPYVSPSNHNAKITGTVMEDESEVMLELEQANLLNSQGIVTFLNMGGWRTWGNETGAFPGNTDPKDRFIAVRRMFNWVENTFITTFFQKVDNPANIRLIETVVDSFNMFLNGLAGQGALLGGQILFNESDNPLTNLTAGKIKFKTKLSPPIPAQVIENEFEIDVDAYKNLF